MNLTHKRCVPCEGGVPPLGREEIEKYRKEVRGWEVIDDKKIRKEFGFSDFKKAMEFVNKIVEIAEAENHHPDFEIHYNHVTLELSTHAIKGLSENDFILAAKIDAMSGRP